MSLALKVIAGPLKDQIIPIDKPVTLGRQGDIVLEDPIVSGIHAHIEKSTSGRWTITDNESKNGIRVNEIRVKSLTLRHGVIFYIGESGFEVFSPEAGASPGAEAPAKAVKKQKLWYEALAEFLSKSKKSFKDRAVPLAPLEPALVLEFVRGVQMNAKWVIGYGPRKLGAASIDLPIWEPNAPEVCFEIRPSAEGILFSTDHPHVVKLNHQSVDKKVLNVGDTITVHDTMIEVDFTE